jgi:hypothetical protein
MKKSFKYLIIALAVSSLLLPLFKSPVQASEYSDCISNVNKDSTGLSDPLDCAGKPGDPQGQSAPLVRNQNGSILPDFANPAVWATGILNLIGGVLLRLGSLVLAIIGLIFDVVLDYTIVKMADQINNVNGLGGGINAAWATLRDIANMAFIFVLLWAAFQTILQLNTGSFGKTIRNIIIIALLINFSLFFTKVVIDASNIATIGFYNSILDGAKTASTDINGFGTVKGFSAIFMKATGVQSFWGGSILSGLSQGPSSNIVQFLTGILGLIVMLVMAIILLVTTVLFLARYIILIFLMVLSPLAFIGYIIPSLSGKLKEWFGHLVNQSFFAPYFMLMTWVSIKLMSAIGPNLQKNAEFAQIGTLPKDVLSLLMNFALVVGFMIMALILSKKMASSTPGFNAVAGGVGAVTVGGAGFIGRQSVGRVGSRLTKSKWLQDKASGRTSANAFTRSLYNVGFSGAQKAGKGSFDARALGDTALGKKVGLGNIVSGIGDKGGAGGFEKYKADKTQGKLDKGKQFTDRQARAAYAQRIASKIGTHRGSLPVDPRHPFANRNILSMGGMVGGSNRIAAATLMDERIKELGTGIGSARGELNGYLNTMGLAGPGIPGPAPTVLELRGARAPTAAELARLSPHEQRRFNDLIAATARDPRTGAIINPDAVDSMNDELNDMRTSRTGLGLQNTLRQQF